MKIFRKILLVIVCILAALFFSVMAVFLTVRITGGKRILSQEEEETLQNTETPPYEMIAVLGCGVRADGSLSPLLEYRMEEVLSLYQEGAAQKILVTGDHREGEYDETDHMAEYLRARGVPDEAIIRDYYGFSTYESLANIKTISQGGRILLVTQRYHLYRALYIGVSEGLDIDGAAAQDWKFGTGTLMRHLREIPACVKDWFLTKTDIQG